jgi:hypothetical protein
MMAASHVVPVLGASILEVCFGWRDQWMHLWWSDVVATVLTTVVLGGMVQRSLDGGRLLSCALRGGPI